MNELVVGCEIEITNIEGKYKVLEIKKDIVFIKFGCLKMEIAIDNITKIYKKKKQFINQRPKSKGYYDFIYFNTTLDLHGKNVSESIDILQEWLEQGIKLGHKYFRIIHGKGNGILHAKVKEFLFRKKLLEFSYENESGGSTIVDLN